MSNNFHASKYPCHLRNKFKSGVFFVSVITWYFSLFLYVSGFWTVWFLAFSSKIMLTHHQKTIVNWILVSLKLCYQPYFILQFSFVLFCEVCGSKIYILTLWRRWFCITPCSGTDSCLEAAAAAAVRLCLRRLWGPPWRYMTLCDLLAALRWSLNGSTLTSENRRCFWPSCWWVKTGGANKIELFGDNDSDILALGWAGIGTLTTWGLLLMTEEVLRLLPDPFDLGERSLLRRSLFLRTTWDCWIIGANSDPDKTLSRRSMTICSTDAGLGVTKT